MRARLLGSLVYGWDVDSLRGGRRKGARVGMEEVVFGDGARIELGGEETGRGKILGAKKKESSFRYLSICPYRYDGLHTRVAANGWF